MANVLIFIVVMSVFMSAVWQVIWKLIPESVMEKVPSWVKSVIIAVLNLIGGCVIVFTSSSDNPIDLMLYFGFESTLFTKILTAIMFVGGPEIIYEIATKIGDIIKGIK